MSFQEPEARPVFSPPEGAPDDPRSSPRAALRLFRTPPRSDPSRYPMEVLEEARKFRLRVGRRGVQVQAYAWGEGPPVLLVHGWGSRAARLGSLVAPLVERGLQAVAFDAPAHGASEGRTSGVQDFHDAIRAVLERTGPLHGAVGHSLGAAALALLFAWEEHPQPERLVLTAGPADMRFILGLFGRQAGVPGPVLAGVRRRMERRFGRGLDEYSLPRQALPPGIRVLLVHDEDDDVVPAAHSHRIARAWPGARLFLTRGLGHSLLVHDPRVVEAVVGFLAGP